MIARILPEILNVSIFGGIAVAMVLVLRRVLKTVPKWAVCGLWMLAFLRLALPFEIRSSFSLQPDLAAVSRSVPVSAVSWELPAMVWLVGMGALTVHGILGYVQLKRKVASARKTEDGCRESDRIDTAFVLGFFVPRVYLPAGLSGRERELIRAHELAHIRRGDHVTKVLGFCVLAMHWFNPLIWYGYHVFCEDIELACDARVVRDMDVSRRKAYSNALVTCGSGRRAFLPHPVAFSEVSVKQRVLCVLRYRRAGTIDKLLAGAAAVFLVLCFMTSPVRLLGAQLHWQEPAFGSETLDRDEKMEGTDPDAFHSSPMEASGESVDTPNQSSGIPNAQNSQISGNGAMNANQNSPDYASQLNKQDIRKISTP